MMMRLALNFKYNADVAKAQEMECWGSSSGRNVLHRSRKIIMLTGHLYDHLGGINKRAAPRKAGGIP